MITDKEYLEYYKALKEVFKQVIAVPKIPPQDPYSASIVLRPYFEIPSKITLEQSQAFKKQQVIRFANALKNPTRENGGGMIGAVLAYVCSSDKASNTLKIARIFFDKATNSDEFDPSKAHGAAQKLFAQALRRDSSQKK